MSALEGARCVLLGYGSLSRLLQPVVSGNQGTLLCTCFREVWLGMSRGQVRVSWRHAIATEGPEK